MNVRDPLDLLPLRQFVAASGEAAEEFAGQALLVALGRPGKFLLARHGPGAQILACNEHALAEAQAMLRRTYGDLVRFGEPNVHSWVDAAAGHVMLPQVYLRIDASRSHARELLKLLEDRGAHERQADLQRHRVIVRSEMPLARSLGITREIGEVTDGAAHVMSWLLRYEATKGGVQ